MAEPTNIQMKEVISAMGSQQIGSQIASNVITIIGVGVMFGLYKLAGDYLITFTFMIIFAIALISIRKSLVESIEAKFHQNKDIWNKHKIYRLHAAKFSIVTSLMIRIYLCFTQFKHLKETLKGLVSTLTDISCIIYAFMLYVIVVKLQCLQQVVIADLTFWLSVDLIRGISYIMRIILCKRKMGQKQERQNQQIQGIIQWIKTSSMFNHLLLYSVMITMILIVPTAIALIYSDFITYKQDLIPKLQKYEIPEEYKAYLSADYILSQIDDTFIPQPIIQQIYQYWNTVDDDNVDIKFLEIFYGDEAKTMYHLLKDCDKSQFCQIKTYASNYNLLNSQFYEYVNYGISYIKEIAPQIQSFASLVSQFLLSIFKGSMQFLVKFILFQQGVLYLLTQQNLKVSNIFVFNVNNRFKSQLANNVNKHISGVFIALFQIFTYHFMLSYVLLDILEIKLAFIQSMVVGILSLIQVIDPGICFLIIISLWQLAGQVNKVEYSIYDFDILKTAVVGIVFYFSSGSIYLTTFKQQLGDPFWTGMSVILGYIAFQWQGLIFGPLLIGAVRTLWEIMKHINDKGQDQVIKQDEDKSQEKVIEPIVTKGKAKKNAGKKDKLE